jgi:hypothetical protein
MTPPTSSLPLADANSWAVDRAISLLEVWALVAAFSGLVGAWRLLGVCRAARAGAKEFLGTLPRLVVSGGGRSGGGAGGRRAVSEVWGLNLTTMRWEAMPALLCGRSGHACCVVRGALVVIGGTFPGSGISQGRFPPTSRVEMLGKGEEAFVELPPLSCGAVFGAVAITVDERHSALGQVLLLGGHDQHRTATSSVRLVDLATGVCTLQANLLHARSFFAAARLRAGSIACAGGHGGATSAEMWERPVHGALDAAWTWKELPVMSVERYGCSGCVLSDGNFAVLGGMSYSGIESSCEALTLRDNERWSPLPPMHDPLDGFACAAVAGCIIVVGGDPYRKSAEVYDEMRGRWLRLPHYLPRDGGLSHMSSALV